MTRGTIGFEQRPVLFPESLWYLGISGASCLLSMKIKDNISLHPAADSIVLYSLASGIVKKPLLTLGMARGTRVVLCSPSLGHYVIYV